MPYYIIYGSPYPLQVYATDPQAALAYAKQALTGQLGATDLASIYIGPAMNEPAGGAREIPGSAKTSTPTSTSTQTGGGQSGAGVGPQGVSDTSQAERGFANLGRRTAETEIDPNTGVPRFVDTGLLTSFRQALANRGINENSLFGEYARNQFNPASDIFQIRSGLGLESAAGDFPFQSFAQGNPNIPKLADQTFYELLRQGQNPENVFTKPYTTGESGTEATSRALSLALQALGGQGKVLPNFIGQTIRPRILEEYQTRAPSENFLSYLRRTLGLA